MKNNSHEYIVALSNLRFVAAIVNSNSDTITYDFLISFSVFHSTEFSCKKSYYHYIIFMCVHVHTSVSLGI